ncbi:MAG: helix-turn-helix transcriptional regulator [Hydrogenophaga sp.]|jgi:transcriptional regulator with XRE-family HTH domain|uniref:helix-turn-helix transcriptional regulator n=1 Tax=Hydrogenophaga sp. TaxID=1904254 RepID=UPI0027241A90|nr:helix-turn-helix transcriptional regulator [Hydrogenophaga sp.]MDO9483550.1 helix-turn-helix transcriptional regulator [Hydrogenophaga sp.]MDO9570277.1 helix-turn-helix transcriptional regulator [Hydrogenophaga sp.]MDP1893201.1 helix-turn-helix transcriptional regulator [Hydrogenophaga sp.]MDP3344259.1 helix-turn-helix transcriptional regulator [Hydrogenophaga sp.]MDP3372636.1 helix-turn-helix transcriptional regulator [Hydrogenophaga sp.]
MNATDHSAVLERQLLLQLGDRLKRLRKAQGLGTVAMAQRVGISRTTLSAVEAGDPGPSIGTYLRVMSLLGVGGELALLAGDTLQPPLPDIAAARSRRAKPVVQVLVSVDETRHQIQDLQSLALHEEAVRRVRADPALLQQAQATLERWLQSGPSRSSGLWKEWQTILAQGQWRKALGRTRRAQALRQASPLTTVLPEDARQNILAQVRELRQGVLLGDAMNKAAP